MGKSKLEEFVAEVKVEPAGDSVTIRSGWGYDEKNATHRFELESMAIHPEASRMLAENVAAAVEVRSDERYLCTMDLRVVVWLKAEKVETPDADDKPAG